MAKEFKVCNVLLILQLMFQTPFCGRLMRFVVVYYLESDYNNLDNKLFMEAICNLGENRDKCVFVCFLI